MNQYLVGQGYWSYINDAQENKPEITNANYPTWEQGASRVMYCLATCVHDHMFSHIRDAKMPNLSQGATLILLCATDYLPLDQMARHNHCQTFTFVSYRDYNMMSVKTI